MTNEIDWTKAPEGATHYTKETNTTSACWVKLKADTCGYITMKHHYNNEAESIWQIGEFHTSELIVIPKPLQPVFTKAMKENMELPPIGSEYHDEDMQLCKALFHYSSFVIGEMLEHAPIQQYPVFSTSRNDRTGYITPPIDLIDGKAYQFEDRRNKVKCGIYNKERGVFSVEQGQYFDDISVTNIQPLTLEVQS